MASSEAWIAKYPVLNGFVTTSLDLSSAGGTSTTWLSNLDQASALSDKTGKPILVDFSATWCGPCQAMIHDTFPDPEVQPLLKGLICVRIDVDDQPQVAERFEVDGIPRILLLNARLQMPARMDVTGYEDPDTFADSLREALGMAPIPGSDTTPAPTSAAETVADALSSNTYSQLRAKNKATAVEGLNDLVAELCEPSDAQPINLTPGMLENAGTDADTALLHAMASGYLAERVGAYSMYRAIAPKSIGSAHLSNYDPWAAKALRAKQLAEISGSMK